MRVLVWTWFGLVWSIDKIGKLPTLIFRMPQFFCIVPIVSIGKSGPAHVDHYTEMDFLYKSVQIDLMDPLMEHTSYKEQEGV